MFKIAICDDEENVCADLERMILEYKQNSNLILEIEVFCNGKDLLKQLQKGECFELLFLDIEMKPINGIKVGREVRETFKNEYTKIVYISGVEGHAMELFDIRPLHFLIKPIQAERVTWIMDKARELLEKYEEVFEFRYNKCIERVPIKDILYFTSEGRKVQLITREVCSEFYGNLSEIEKQLHYDFIRIHKSYLINKNYIAEYTYENIRLLNNEGFNITRKYRNEIRDNLMRRGLQ